MNLKYRAGAFYVAAFLFISFPVVTWAAIVDLSTFIIEDYFGPSNWVVSGPGNSQVTQTTNADPSFFRSGGQIDVANKRIKGEILITGADDDSVGFVFGYQNRGQMYLFGWKEAVQGTLRKGMYLSLIDTGSSAVDPDILDFYNTGSNSASKTILRENDFSWTRNVTYSFMLDFKPGNFEISILDGTAVLEAWAVSDATFSGGDFGFFNGSQPNVTYGNLEVIPIPAAAWLFGSGLIGLIGVARRKKA